MNLEEALNRYSIPVEQSHGLYYLSYPPVRGAHFQIVPGPGKQVTLHFFDALMGSVAASGKPIRVTNDPHKIASVIKTRLKQWNTAILENPRGASQKPSVHSVVQRYLRRLEG